MAALRKPYAAAVCGVKNSGKTTFLEKLVKELNCRGYRVAVVKHDGHDFQADTEGTDTFRMQKAGAYGTCVFSKNKWMAVKQETEVELETLFNLFGEADMILVEGMKDSLLPKFELVRKGVSCESICNPRNMLGLVTDTSLKIPGIPVLGMREVRRCADILEQEMHGNIPEDEKQEKSRFLL